MNDPLAARAEAGTPPRPRGVGQMVLALVLLALALAVLLVAPAVVYRCDAAPHGARCAVTWRYAGLLELKRVEVDGVLRAEGSTHEVAVQDPNGSNRHESESRIVFYGEADKELYTHEESGLIGATSEEIAQDVFVVARHQLPGPLVRWQVGWMPLLFASILLLLGVPVLVQEIRVRLPAPLREATWLDFTLVVVPLLAAWVLAFMGSF